MGKQCKTIKFWAGGRWVVLLQGNGVQHNNRLQSQLSENNKHEYHAAPHDRLAKTPKNCPSNRFNSETSFLREIAV